MLFVMILSKEKALQYFSNIVGTCLEKQANSRISIDNVKRHGGKDGVRSTESV